MAWRFHEHIVRGELDNTVRGRVTGRIWLAGIAEPMTLDLRGDCAPDLAGCTFTFENPNPVPFVGDGPSLEQRGWVGDITASQKCKVHDVPMDEVLRLYELGQPAPWHWANTLYIEWHSTTNGGITIQTSGWLDEAQREAARWRRNFYGLRSDVSRWHKHLTRPAEPEPFGENAERVRAFRRLFDLPEEILNAPDPLAAILERNIHADEEAED